MPDTGEEVVYAARGNFKAGVSVLTVALDMCTDRMGEWSWVNASSQLSPFMIIVVGTLMCTQQPQTLP